MKKFLIVLFILISINTSLFSESINFTGICYENVKISKKTKILNPTPIVYKDQPDKLIYSKKLPIYMKSAGYWISKTQNPDDVFLKEKQIKEFNNQIKLQNVGLRKIEDYRDTINTIDLQKNLESRLSWLKKGKYIGDHLNKISKEFFLRVQNTIDLDISEPVISTRFAITTKYSEIRILPTDIAIYSNPNSLDIDKMQEESIDIGTPLAILCQTKNKRWSYAIAPREEGWIKTENIAFTDKKNIEKWNSYKKIAVATDVKTDIFLDKNLKQYLGYIRMGTFFPLKKKKKDFVIVQIPTTDENGNLVITDGYISKSSVNVGFLEYTQRKVLVQAFKHLNSPYGWGGSDGEQDCSGILGQIFNCFGIILPENSAQKIKCGQITTMDRYEDINVKKQKIMENAVPGMSFIYLKGHIMLYIGYEQNEPYVLHDVWGLSAFNDDNEPTILYINKTIVSDLNLGDIVNDNSLIERTIKFSILK